MSGKYPDTGWKDWAETKQSKIINKTALMCEKEKMKQKLQHKQIQTKQNTTKRNTIKQDRTQQNYPSKAP